MSAESNTPPTETKSTDQTNMMKMMMAMMAQQKTPQKPQQMAPQQPKLTPYDQLYIKSKNALDSDFILKGLEYRMVKWRLERDLLEKYNRRQVLPDYTKLSVRNLV
jgi:hypothetical protein